MLTAEDIRAAVGGKFFHVKFIKRTNGELRAMRCRIDVSKYVSGVGAKYNFSSKGLLSVYDMDKRGYRAVPLDAITEFRCGSIRLKKNGKLSKRKPASRPRSILPVREEAAYVR